MKQGVIGGNQTGQNGPENPREKPHTLRGFKKFPLDFGGL